MNDGTRRENEKKKNREVRDDLVLINVYGFAIRSIEATYLVAFPLCAFSVCPLVAAENTVR